MPISRISRPVAHPTFRSRERKVDDRDRCGCLRYGADLRGHPGDHPLQPLGRLSALTNQSAAAPRRLGFSSRLPRLFHRADVRRAHPVVLARLTPLTSLMADAFGPGKSLDMLRAQQIRRAAARPGPEVAAAHAITSKRRSAWHGSSGAHVQARSWPRSSMRAWAAIPGSVHSWNARSASAGEWV